MRANTGESNGGKASRVQSKHPESLLHSHRLFLNNIILLKNDNQRKYQRTDMAFSWHIPCMHKVYVVVHITKHSFSVKVSLKITQKQ